MTLGDRIVIMRDGEIQQVGTPQEVFDHPANLFVAGFIGMPRMNTFDAQLQRDPDGKYAVQLANAHVVLSDEKQARLAQKNVQPGPIVLGIRPEQSVESFLGGLPGRYRPAEGPCKAQGAQFTLESSTGLCTAVERVEIR